MRSELAWRTNSNWQGLPLVLHSRKTQSNSSQQRAGEMTCLKERVAAGLDRWGEDCCPPSKKKCWKSELGEDYLVGGHGTSVQAICLSGDLDTHSYWSSVHCNPKLNDPKGKSCLRVLVDVWGERWIFCSFVQQRLQRAVKQNQISSPYQTFSFLLPSPPPNGDHHLTIYFVDVTAELYLGHWTWIWPALSSPAWTFVKFLRRKKKNYAFLVIIMKASHV